MSKRRTDGDETWNRLLNWTKGQKSSERLAAQILRSEGFESIDPSHPLGGKDTLKDIITIKDQIKWIGAFYFPRGQQTFLKIKNKFLTDLKGVQKNKVKGIAFVTNQELTLGERKELEKVVKSNALEIYHLERISGILDSPNNYGIRLEFLDIELTKEEHLSFIANRDEKLFQFTDRIEKLITDYDQYKSSFDFDESSEVFKERTLEEILTTIDELTDKIWYDRHQVLKYRIDNKLEEVDPEIWKGALKAAKKVEKKLGVNDLGPYSKFDWGMLNGKLSALRWLLGDEWDMLDT